MSSLWECATPGCGFVTMAEQSAALHRHSGFRVHDYSGLVQMRKARETGTYVGIYKAMEAGLDVDSGPYNVVCEAHGTILGTETLTAARDHATNPTGWCEECRT